MDLMRCGYRAPYSRMMFAVLSVEASSWINISTGKVVSCMRKPSRQSRIYLSWLYARLQMLTTGTVPSGQTCSVTRTGRASLGAALCVTAGIGTSLLKSDLSLSATLLYHASSGIPPATATQATNHADRPMATQDHPIAAARGPRKPADDENSAGWRKHDSWVLQRSSAGTALEPHVATSVRYVRAQSPFCAKPPRPNRRNIPFHIYQ